MQKPTGTAAGPICEITLVNHKNAISCGSQVLGGRGPIDPCPYYGDVKFLAIKRFHFAFLYRVTAIAAIPAPTTVAANNLCFFGPSPNHMTPISAAKITEVSLSADTMPSGAIDFA